ncbi:related to IST1 - protein with a positive role in the multivesicular body sorting pathway [Melanopsichium pennsylvanicum]|uniref:Related to IST1 - protein with a positive role in the multivesicular body sorting pathway n=2 Tax=Melanopsichium pennsylvanicum TaxID=63383 RepID=A0AAJ4XLB0_9BASI|nr:related to IST1 - protein with a positive role in the multivesicular body sorting pathway [Melanopsichium pennsylvanicum]
MAKQARRDISALIDKGKVETARIKTEGIISEDIHLELLELMELYAETLLARFTLLDLPTREPDVSILPALTSIIHAAPRTELKELHVLRDMLMSKYGRELAQDIMDNKDSCVPERVMTKLLVETPDPKLVDLYIFEICRAYDVAFSSPLLPETMVQEENNTEQQEAQMSKEEAEVEKQIPSNSAKDAAKSAHKLKPANRTSNKHATSTDVNDKPGAPTKNKTEKDDVDSLEARFAALKRR